MTVKKETEEVAELNPEVASQMLSNIFEACDYEANAVPLEVMSSYQNYYQEKNYLQRWIIVLILLGLMFLPVLFLTPHITLEQREITPGAVEVSARYDCPLPIERITAMIDQFPVAIHETEKGIFEIRPDRNGLLRLEITLINKQSACSELQITNVDRDAPELVKSELQGKLLTIYFSDASGSLNYDTIYALNSSGDRIEPLSYDASAMSVTFRYPGEGLNIFVEDRYGNSLQLVLTVW